MNGGEDPEITKAIAAEVEKRCGDKEGCQLIEGDRITREYVHEGKLPRVDYTKIIEHIDHAVKLVGAAHVGLGSDLDRKSTRLNSSHQIISYAVFCLKKKISI